MSNMPRRRVTIPLWVKLGGGLLLATILPVAFVTVIFLTGSQDVDRRNITSYISQNGQRQWQVVSNAFDRAREDLRAFEDTPLYNRQMSGLLLNDVQAQPVLPASTSEQVQDTFEGVLLDDNTTTYEGIRLLTTDGEVVAAAGNPFLSSIGLGQFETESQAFRGIVAARQETPELQQLMVVARRADPVIELVNVVNLGSTDVPIGYLIATLDNERVVLSNISFAQDGFPAYSFLLSDNNVIIAEPANRTLAELSIQSTGPQRALNNEIGVTAYRLDGGVGEEVIGYFAPVSETPFVLVTQVATDAVLRQALDFIGTGGVALAVGLLALTLVIMIGAYNQLLTPSLRRLQHTMQAMMLGNFEENLPDVARNDEIGEVSRTFVTMRGQVKQLVTDLEARVSSRTRDIETTQEISRYAASQRDVQQLMNDVVSLIVEQFPNIYHAQIFLLDGDKRYAVLRASTGEVGDELLKRGHRLAVGSISVIGQVTARGEVIVARDTAMSEVHRQNEFLVDTRSELAIPLRIGTDIIGALDVQSRESETFTQDQVNVLQTMADQVAVAIENARLYQESVRRLREIEKSNQQATLRAWQEYMYDRRRRRFEREAGIPTNLDTTSLRQQALSTGEIAVGDRTNRDTIPIAVPIRLRGETLGAVEWELPAVDYNRSKLLLAQDLADRLAISLDNTRLFEQSQRATEHERLVNDIAAKLTAETDINAILKTTVREVGRALRAPQVSIRLTPSKPDDA